MIKATCDFLGREPQGKSPSSQFSGHGDFGQRELMIVFSTWSSKTPHQNVIWLYGQEPITVSFYPDKFGGQRHSTIKFLVCQVIWKDCMVKGSSDFMGLESLIVSHHSARFGGHKHCGKGDEMLSVVEEEDPICPCFNLPLIFLSKELQWLQFNMWSLSHVDRVLLTCLHVLGDTSWCSGTRTFICLLVFLQ